MRGCCDNSPFFKTSDNGCNNIINDKHHSDNTNIMEHNKIGGVELRHNFATMLLWEQVTGQPFALANVTDIVKYAYICYIDAGGEGKDLVAFARELTNDHVEALMAQMMANTPKVAEEGKKKA